MCGWKGGNPVFLLLFFQQTLSADLLCRVALFCCRTTRPKKYPPLSIVLPNIRVTPTWGIGCPNKLTPCPNPVKEIIPSSGQGPMRTFYWFILFIFPELFYLLFIYIYLFFIYISRGKCAFLFEKKNPNSQGYNLGFFQDGLPAAKYCIGFNSGTVVVWKSGEISLCCFFAAPPPVSCFGFFCQVCLNFSDFGVLHCFLQLPQCIFSCLRQFFTLPMCDALPG